MEGDGEVEVCVTKGHKLQVIVTFVETTDQKRNEVAILRNEVYHGSICIRCGQVFDRPT